MTETQPDVAPPPQKVVGVLGMALGVVALFGLLGLLAWQQGGAIDGAAALAEVFETPPESLGFHIDEARDALGGQRFVRLSRAADAAPAPDRPDELLIGLYSGPGMARSAVQGGAGGLNDENLRKWKEDAAFEFRAELERGDLEFGSWRAPYNRVRHYQKGSVFRDEVRVDLSNARRGVSLLARWPVGRDGTKATAEALLGEFRFRPAPEPAPPAH